MQLSLLTLVSALSSIASATLEVQVTELTYTTDDCSGRATGGDIVFPFDTVGIYFNEIYPSSLYVAWSDISGSPAMSVQFLINSTCNLPDGSAVVPFQDLFINKEGCYNLTGLYDKSQAIGMTFLPLVPADAAVPLANVSVINPY